MKIHKKFVFLSLAVMTSLIFAKNVNAVVINNIRNINTEDVTVITTTTPTPKVEITIKPIKKIEIRTTLKKTNALKEINRRLESLNKLVSKTEGEMLRTKNFGRKSLNEIKEILTNTL